MGELIEGIIRKSVSCPVLHRDCAEGFVEVDCWFVPVEDGPFEAGALSFCCDLGEVCEDLFAVAFAAVGGFYVEIFEIEAWACSEG